MGIRFQEMTKKEKKTGQGDESGKNTVGDDEVLFFDYHFQFKDGEEHTIRIHLDPETLLYLPQKSFAGGDWTRLELHQCENCPLSAEHDPNCAVALCIEGLVKEFSDKFSYETAEITVATNERTYSKRTTMQKVVSSILGILMVSSGCPVMAKLRPMVRFHLPFSTVLETTFRTITTYLLGQFFLKKRGKAGDFTFEGLTEIYKNVNMVNAGMARRINSMAGKDASVNALIVLDIFAMDVPLSIEDQVEELQPLFSSYFD